MNTSDVVLNVRAFGARGDGIANDTAALQRALDAAAQVAGTLIVPQGRYRTGTLFVRSHTTLELTAGATLVGPRAGEWDRFIPIVDADASFGNPPEPRRHLLVIRDAERVTIRGRGTIDGQGWEWSQDGAQPESWRVASDPRPDVMVAAIRARDLVLEGIRLTDPPNWNLDLFCCDRVRVTGLTIASDPRLPNNDGIDVSGSQDVIISDCQIHVGDDGIVLNGRARPTRRVTVTNCLISSDCAALKVGWEYTRHDISQVTFSNCVLTGCNRGFACYSVNGATIEDVVVSNLVLDSNAPVFFSRPIHLDLRRGRDTGVFGRMRRIQVSNVLAHTPGRILMTCENGGHLEDITLRDVRLTYPFLEDPEPVAEQNSSHQFSNANRAARRARAAVVAENIRRLRVDGLQVDWPNGPVPTEWRIPAKRENGGTRIFRPDYDQPKSCPFAVVWGRGIERGTWRNSTSVSSDPVTPAFDLDTTSELERD